MSYELAGRRVWVAGHRGMVGRATVRRLRAEGAAIVTAERAALDLRQQQAVDAFMARERPDVVVVAAGKVGGILANASQPADFLYDNLMIAANVIAAAHAHDVGRLLFLGSSCIYPRLAPQPIPEEALLSGPLEPSNAGYALAKIAGIKLVEACRAQYGRDYIAAMPCNLYGPGDNFALVSSHVLPALIRKAHEAKGRGEASMTLWGSGMPRREFLHVEDCADALVFLLRHYSGAMPINVGSGVEISILELARLVCAVVGFEGEIVHDLAMPEGTPRKLMSAAKLRALGWAPRIGLEAGIRATYAWFCRTGGRRAA